MSRIILSALTISLLVFMAGDAIAKQGKDRQDINLEFKGKPVDGGKLVTMSGWPLTLELRAVESKFAGFGRDLVSGPIQPQRNDDVKMIFGDPLGPDGCPSYVDRGTQQTHYDNLNAEPPGPPAVNGCENPPLPPWPVDELTLPIETGVSAPGYPSDPLALDETPLQAIVYDFDTGANTRLQSYGPDLGTESDGYGFGASPRVQGLVLLSDTGPGFVLDENFALVGPTRQCRNLAGFANTVGLELVGHLETTNVSVTFNIPRQLLSPVIAWDGNLNCMRPDGTEGGLLARVDGEPTQCYTGLLTGDAPVGLNDAVTLRAFVVSVDQSVVDATGQPQAPDVISDMDGNGVCDIDDAKAMGYRVLSGEEVTQVRQFHEEFFGFSVDLNGDGDVGDVVLPAGPGGIFFPPR